MWAKGVLEAAAAGADRLLQSPRQLALPRKFDASGGLAIGSNVWKVLTTRTTESMLYIHTRCLDTLDASSTKTRVPRRRKARANQGRRNRRPGFPLYIVETDLSRRTRYRSVVGDDGAEPVVLVAAPVRHGEPRIKPCVCHDSRSQGR